MQNSIPQYNVARESINGLVKDVEGMKEIIVHYDMLMKGTYNFWKVMNN